MKVAKPLIIILLIISIFIFVDLSNLDSSIYKQICFLLFFNKICPDFYDLPIWQVSVSIGTISAAYFAFIALTESNRHFDLEQTPHVVIKDRIITDAANKLHVIMLKNIGKGSAASITATADPDGKISIINGSNPHSIELTSGEPHNNWAIDENRVVEGLRKQGIHVNSSVFNEIPDENSLSVDQKDKADFKLFLWYSDQRDNKYKTETTIRHSGPFMKVMKNKVERS